MEITPTLLLVLVSVGVPVIVQAVKLLAKAFTGTVPTGTVAKWLTFIVGTVVAVGVFFASGQPLPTLPDFTGDLVIVVGSVLNTLAAWLVFLGVIYKVATTVYDALLQKVLDGLRLN